MANDFFQFKQFLVNQERAVFKVGTDSVLLGAWTDVSGAGTVLDIGTGTGILALMMAQRSAAVIHAIEIDNSSCEQADENFRGSPWAPRIRLFNTSLQGFRPDHRYDLVVSNPPYFQDSLRSPEPGKNISRHDTGMSLEELTLLVPPLLEENGRFCLVLPSGEGGKFEKLARGTGLYLHRYMSVSPTTRHPEKRRLLEYRLRPSDPVVQEELAIEKGARHDYTEEYRRLTRDFYLAF